MRVYPYEAKWKRSASECLVSAWGTVEHVPRFFSDFIATQARKLRACNTPYGWNRVIVAADTDTVIGMVVCKVEYAKRRLYVSSLAVLPAYQRQGVATALLDDVQAYARSRDLRSVWLFAEDFNPRANQLYRKYGFTFKKYVMIEPGEGYEKDCVAIRTNLLEMRLDK